MQQHPIPQNVMTVEFQLVGNLTLRQFGYIAVGGVICFTLFLLPIYGFIKWPLIVTIGALAASMAYLPINDIGLDRWIIAFFRAVNSPTKRLWIRDAKQLPIFASDYAKRFSHEENTISSTADRSRLNTYLAELQRPEGKTELDVAEETYINSLPFEVVGAPPLPPKVTELPTPVSISPTIKPLAQPNALEEKRTVEEDIIPTAPIIPKVTTPPHPVITVHMPDKNVYVKKVSTTTVNRVLHSLSSLQGISVMPVRGEKSFEPSQQLRELLTPPNQQPSPQPKQTTSPLTQAPPTPPTPQYIEELKMPPVALSQKTDTSPSQAYPQLNFNEQLAIETKLAKEAEEARAKLAKPAVADNLFAAPKVTLQKIENPPPPPTPQPPKSAPLPELPQEKYLKEEKLEQIPSLSIPVTAQPEQQTVDASPAIGKMAPLPATVPNVIIGLVRSQNGLLLTDVIIVVKDVHREPVRALKSNKVGQFAITTALPNGTYWLDLSKEQYHFDTIKVILNGQIFQPIEIKAR
jgi:PrgI family protein